MPEALERHQKWLLASGILAILAGIVAIAVPAAASAAIDLFIGWLLLFSSAFALVDVFAPPRSAGRVAVRLVCAALFLAAGVYLAASRPPRTPWPEASEIVNRTRPCATAIWTFAAGRRSGSSGLPIPTTGRGDRGHVLRNAARRARSRSRLPKRHRPRPLA
jgi:hypothetical protein